MQLAYQKLVEQRADNAPPIALNPREHALGFCLYADERMVSSHPEYSPRWMDVAAICQQNRDRIQNAYVDMVRQVEFAGGAYSDEQVVLSMTAEQMGLPKSNERNWLWMKNVPDQSSELNNNYGHGSVTGKWMDFHHRNDFSPFVWKPPFDWQSDASIYYRNQGIWTNETKEEGFGQAVWHSNGDAWAEVFALRTKIRDKSGKNRNEDFMKSMSELPDMFTEACKRDANGNCETEVIYGKIVNKPGPHLPLFTGITGKPFWMVGKGFTFDARSSLTIQKDWINNEKSNLTVSGIKCFMADGINSVDYRDGSYIGYYAPETSWMASEWKNYKFYTLSLSGKVCSTSEMAAMQAQHRNSFSIEGITIDKCTYSQVIGSDIWGNTEFAKSNASLCSSFGGGTQQKYRQALGWMIVNAREYTVPLGSDFFQVDKYVDNFKPYTDGNLYHMPVVDISERKCKYQMVGNKRRQANRMAGGVNIPSICGADMDKLISDIIPRPEFPPVPESVVRVPEL
jgi:hypothetical protein